MIVHLKMFTEHAFSAKSGFICAQLLKSNKVLYQKTESDRIQICCLFLLIHSLLTWHVEVGLIVWPSYTDAKRETLWAGNKNALLS